MIIKEVGIVDKIISNNGFIIEIEVTIGNRNSKAIAYKNLIEKIEPADSVLLNTTAYHKKLGTGGCDFVIANLSNITQKTEHFSGHIVKCRYTPVQHTVLSVEEPDSPYHEKIKDIKSIDKAVVIVGQLHSQLPVISAALKEMSDFKANVVYIMSDYSSLAMAFSKTVYNLKRKGLIDYTISCGQAFGGDYEAVNIYTAMIFAKHILNADFIVVIPGPGNVGTGTKLGFSSIEQGNVLNAVKALEGIPVCVSRICFVDKRKRHYGLSHHTITMLEMVASSEINVVLPELDENKKEILIKQIKDHGIDKRHNIIFSKGIAGFKTVEEKYISLNTMGRNFNETPEFFKAASAAAEVAFDLRKK